MDLELYEFQYGLKNITPAAGWKSIQPDTKEEIEAGPHNSRSFCTILFRSNAVSKIVSFWTTRSFVYPICCLWGWLPVPMEKTWVDKHFYFDVRGFFFLHRTTYFTEKVLSHLDGKPLNSSSRNRKLLSVSRALVTKISAKPIGRWINCSLRVCINSSSHTKSRSCSPLLGQPRRERLRSLSAYAQTLKGRGKKTTSIELDNFLTDRDYREEKGIFTQGKAAFHFGLFTQSLVDISHGKKISIPRYDFVEATSSHDLESNLKPDGIPIEIEPADIIFIEGNFPFLE